MADHAVVRTDLMFGTDVRSGLYSIQYMGADGETPTEIENGNVVKVGALMDAEREIHIGTTPSSSDDINEIALIASVEVMYDERKRNLDEFTNEAGDLCRGYILHSRDIFSVTADALDGTPAVGSSVTLGDSTKLVVDGSGTNIGTIIEEEVAGAGRYTYYAIRVD